MTELCARFADRGGPLVRCVFAGSGEVARQVLAGAPADLVVMADAEWMDRLAAEGAIRNSTRADLLINQLVVIAPANRQPAPFSWNGRMAIGDPDSVPAGRYARAMLQRLGVWDSVQPRLVTAADVRAVRAFVARGDVDLGVVYATDALGSDEVRVVWTPPAEAQPAIVYPAAITTSAADGAGALLAWLQSDEASLVYARYGFGRAA